MSSGSFARDQFCAQNWRFGFADQQPWCAKKRIISSSSSPMISALSRYGVVVARTAASTRGLACSVRTS
jgi:hypothetical protein